MHWAIIGYVTVLSGFVGCTFAEGKAEAALPLIIIFTCGACAGAFLANPNLFKKGH